ncbi:unnamed protein product [Phytophthora fragariaefolia]|uniref:Unnamed protein product n=1 Tax=Phytophthora fragariaefolia TaxID=1490495 RepID=A0A9W6UFR3_9STRA|nr:unnamed protein product [Phytophthora fragariaefolia]
MTGSLFAPLSLSSPSPVQSVAPNYSVNSFSEFSTRIVNRAAACSPTSPTSGSRSARPKEEDEELFRDLFAGENDAETNDAAPTSCKSALTTCTFLPQKPSTKRVPSTINPRQHLAPMKPVPPQPILYIPRLRLEELVNARPDNDDDDDDENNNISRRPSRRGSELEQVVEEDDDNDDGEGAPRKAQVLNRDRGFNSALRLTSNNQRSNNNETLEHETLRFLERLDLKSVLYTPRPDLVSFYPSIAATPSTTRSMVSPYPRAQTKITQQLEDRSVENHYPELEKVRADATNEKNDDVYNYKDLLKVPLVDGVASRLAYMESTYGTVPIVRKTRRETINRLANPICGHSSTLQALSPKQREKREAALTSRALTSPLSAAIAVSRSVLRKGKPSLLGELSKRDELPVPMFAASKRKPLTYKRRPTNVRPDGNCAKVMPANDQPTRESNLWKSIYSTGTVTQATGKARGCSNKQSPLDGLTRRKGKPTAGARSLSARKEALKKKLNIRPSVAKRHRATFLTQRDDEEGVEMIEDFIARNRGAAQASLTFRSGRKTTLRQTISVLPKKHGTTDRAYPRPPLGRAGVQSARISGTNKSLHRERAVHTSRELESLGHTTQKYFTNDSRSGTEHEVIKLIQKPRRPEAWIASSSRALTGRPNTPGGAANPLRKLKVHHPTMPTLLTRPPKSPPSAASTLLMDSLFSRAISTSSRAPRQDSKRPSGRKTDRSTRRTRSTFDAPTKVSAQRRRTTAPLAANSLRSAVRLSSRLGSEEKPPAHARSRL